ncbi:MAG: MmgE/PrpD family protein [Herminiimonas sp.]|nr:MmgE/PrpD family protein [Herminiimonas sp.]
MARFLAEARWDDIPAAVRHEAMRSLMNFFATALGGCRDPAIETAAAVLGRFSAGSNATTIGRPEKYDSLTAASLNAMSANVFDFDDTHVPTIIHPTAPVAPAVFALAESARLTGRQLLLAFILGVELECRLGNAVSPGHYQRGWHITATCGVFGAAVAAGKALGLDARRMAWAIGHASAQSSGLVETLGSMSKSIGIGNAARNGIVSALLAERNFTGPERPLEGRHGFLHVMADQHNIDALTAELGARWEILSNTYKPYPCGVVLMPVIEATVALHANPELSLAEIERIELTGNPLLRVRTDRPGVQTGREAQVSAQHGVAVALSRGKAGLVEFSDACVAEPDLRALGAKVVFIDDDQYSVDAARVTVFMRSGESFSEFVGAAHGGLARPLTDLQLESKLRELNRYGGSGCDADRLIDAIWALGRSDDAGAVMALASGRG